MNYLIDNAIYAAAVLRDAAKGECLGGGGEYCVGKPYKLPREV